MLVKYLLMIVCLSFASSIYAEEECTDCATGENEHVEVNDKEIQDLANQICNSFILFRESGAGEIWEAFQGPILTQLKASDESPRHHPRITGFWNKYHNQMICTDDHIGFKTPQHILKRAIDMNVITSFYFDYLLRDKGTNVNAIEYIYNQP